MKNFEYVSAPDLENAISLLSQENSKALAGGTDLLTELKERLRTPKRLVNLKQITDMQGISAEADKIKIGALSTISEIESHNLIAENFPSLDSSRRCHSEPPTAQFRHIRRQSVPTSSLLVLPPSRSHLLAKGRRKSAMHKRESIAITQFLETHLV